MDVVDIDRGYKRIREELDNLKNNYLEVGIRKDNPTVVNGKRLVEYAEYNEYGTKHIPPRSFIGSTADDKKDKWFRIIKRSYENILTERTKTAEDAFLDIGDIASKDIKDKIASNIQPENAPATKLKKGGSINAQTTTLIDTGTMRNAIEYKIVKKDV